MIHFQWRHVVAGDGAAIRPLHTRLEGPGHVMPAPFILTPPLGASERRSRESGTCAVRRDVNKAEEHAVGDFDVGLRLREVRIDRIGYCHSARTIFFVGVLDEQATTTRAA